jgi:hypothetical protein
MAARARSVMQASFAKGEGWNGVVWEGRMGSGE